MQQQLLPRNAAVCGGLHPGCLLLQLLHVVQPGSSSSRQAGSRCSAANRTPLCCAMLCWQHRHVSTAAAGAAEELLLLLLLQIQLQKTTHARAATHGSDHRWQARGHALAQGGCKPHCW
jgi:hypothetical protein